MKIKNIDTGKMVELSLISAVEESLDVIDGFLWQYLPEPTHDHYECDSYLFDLICNLVDKQSKLNQKIRNLIVIHGRESILGFLSKFDGSDVDPVEAINKVSAALDLHVALLNKNN